MFHDLISFIAWPITTYREEFPWSLVAMIVLLAVIRARRSGRGRGDAWRKRMEEMRERTARNEAELRAYHEQVLVELRQQNDMLRKLLAERSMEVETPAADNATPDLFAESTPDAPAEATEPASEI